jgi:hypothetical protein
MLRNTIADRDRDYCRLLGERDQLVKKGRAELDVREDIIRNFQAEIVVLQNENRQLRQSNNTLREAQAAEEDSYETVLEEAARIVDGKRQHDYGTPAENHGRTAMLWNDYLSVEGITARDVCAMNILQKLSRDVYCPKRDNLVDIAGYARVAEMVDEPDPEAEDDDHGTEF